MVASGRGQSLDIALSNFVKHRLVLFAGLSVFISVLPLHVGVWLGNRGQPMFALLAPFLLLIVTGLVAVSWWILKVCIWTWRVVMRILPFGKTYVLYMPFYSIHEPTITYQFTQDQ